MSMPSNEPLLSAPTQGAAPPGGSNALRRFLSNRMAVAGTIVVLLLVLLARFAPWIAPHHPNDDIFRGMRGVGSSLKHPMGFDYLSRDLLSRVIYGTGIALTVGLLSTLISVVIGRGRRRAGRLLRRLDRRGALAHHRHADGVPAHRAAHRARGGAGAKPHHHRHRDRRDRLGAVRASGARRVAEPARARLRHRRPRAGRVRLAHHPAPRNPQRAHVSNRPRQPAGGRDHHPRIGALVPGSGHAPANRHLGILSDGRAFVLRYPLIAVFPGVMVVITVLAFNFIGDGLRDALDPHGKTNRSR